MHTKRRRARYCLSLGNTRFRLHIYKSGGKPAAAIRVLPELSALPADPDKAFLDKLSALEHGLVLITGPSGSGKSTTLAHILLTAVAKRPCHIVTLEDPVEYVISSDKALVHQREIGEDTPSFAEGVIESLREDPDIIAVGEMRDAATIEAALTAAETGHLSLPPSTPHVPKTHARASSTHFLPRGKTKSGASFPPACSTSSRSASAGRARKPSSCAKS